MAPSDLRAALSSVRPALPWALALTALVASVPVRAAEISGRVSLVSSRSGRPARGVEIDQTVVAFVPQGSHRPAPPETPFEMATVRKAFEPEVLVVPTGSIVLFPNFDPILHNVFSVTPGNAFDVGVYGRGEGKSAILHKTGVVRVFCNVHQDMFGHILVLDTPYFRRVDADGTFVLEDLPAGPGELITWHPQGKLERRRIGSARRDLALEIETDRRRVPRHLNKFGKPYRSRRGRYSG